jgi:hypothetical protein
MPAAERAARSDPQCRAILQKRATGRHYRVAVSHVARKSRTFSTLC